MKQIQETLTGNPYAGDAEKHITWTHDWQGENGDTTETQLANPALAQAYATLALAYEFRRQTKKEESTFDLAKTKRLISDLTDPGECHFDHHGGCQEHGYLTLEPGQMCPNQEAKEWVKSYEDSQGISE